MDKPTANSTTSRAISTYGQTMVAAEGTFRSCMYAGWSARTRCQLCRSETPQVASQRRGSLWTALALVMFLANLRLSPYRAGSKSDTDCCWGPCVSA